MKFDFVILELDIETSKHLKEHFVHLKDVTEKGFYREATSFDAFKSPSKGRNKTDTLHFIARWRDEWERSNKLWTEAYARYNIPKDVIPHIFHESLDDFYQYIGYDKKTKKFIFPRNTLKVPTNDSEWLEVNSLFNIRYSLKDEELLRLLYLSHKFNCLTNDEMKTILKQYPEFILKEYPPTRTTRNYKYESLK